MAKGGTKSFRIDDLLCRKTSSESSTGGSRNGGYRGETGDSDTNHNHHQERHEKVGNRAARISSGAQQGLSTTVIASTKNSRSSNGASNLTISNIGRNTANADGEIYKGKGSNGLVKPVPLFNPLSLQFTQAQLAAAIASGGIPTTFNVPFYEHHHHNAQLHSHPHQHNPIFQNGSSQQMSGNMNSINSMPFGSVHHQHHLHQQQQQQQQQQQTQQNSHSQQNHSSSISPVVTAAAVAAANALTPHHSHPLHHSFHPSMWNHLLPSPFDARNQDRAALFLSLQNRLNSYGVAYGNGRQLNPMINVGSKRKGGQIRFSNSQTAQLEKAFLEHKYLNANDRKKLANSLGLTDRQVKTWFQNRRAKLRKCKEGNSCEAEARVSGSSYTRQEDFSPDGGRCDSPNSIETGDSSC